jgi:putative endonuclease
MTNSTETGVAGEEIAANYLADKGYKILYRNWRYMKKELDLIATYKNELIIVEVKTRMRGSLITPLEAVNLRKQRFIISAANAFIEKHDVNLEVRFDIVTIVYNFNNYTVEHIENAFYPIVR